MCVCVILARILSLGFVVAWPRFCCGCVYPRACVSRLCCSFTPAAAGAGVRGALSNLGVAACAFGEGAVPLWLDSWRVGACGLWVPFSSAACAGFLVVVVWFARGSALAEAVRSWGFQLPWSRRRGGRASGWRARAPRRPRPCKITVSKL